MEFFNWFSSGEGQFFIATVFALTFGGGCISYLSYFYDKKINSRGEAQDILITNLLKNEREQTKDIKRMVEHIDQLTQKIYEMEQGKCDVRIGGIR